MTSFMVPPPSIGRGEVWGRRRAARCSGSPPATRWASPRSARVVRRRDGPHGHAGRAAGGDARRRVLEHDAVGGVDAEALGREQVGVGRRLPAGHHVGGDEDVRAGQPGAREAGAGERQLAGGDDRDGRRARARPPPRAGARLPRVGDLGVGDEAPRRPRPRRRGRAGRSRGAPGGRGWPPGSRRRRGRGARPTRPSARPAAPIESTSTPSRSERTAANVTPAPARPPAARRRGRAAPDRAAGQREHDDAAGTSIASAHGSEVAPARKPISGGPAGSRASPARRRRRCRGRAPCRAPAGGAEHQRHAVGDAEADQEEGGERDRRRAEQQHHGERDRRQQGAPAQQRDRAHAAVDPVADQRARPSCPR